MPLVGVEIVLKPQETIPDAIASEPADELGQIFDSPRTGTWVKVPGIADVFAQRGGQIVT